ncbi:MAG: molybdopterin converting factor subunit 1 [Kordiimonas sp.]|nr:molybdopterin converting factor subunit 1 [Kordiimonas sp.]|tara:strand:+ start:6746 stop:7006 length:261 start_codon:yes stop_codon:yes gene_type:complete
MAHLLYFALIREQIGHPEEQMSLPPGVTTVQKLIDHLRSCNDHYARAFADMQKVRVAVNEEYVSLHHPISANDEIAFFPPMTGGRL